MIQNKQTGIKVMLSGKNGNIFNLIAIASAELKKKGFAKHSADMMQNIIKAKSYEESISIIMEYVEVN